MNSGFDDTVRRILDDASAIPADVALAVAAWPPARRAALITALLPHAAGRRWLRGELLAELNQDGAAALARGLMYWADDFAPGNRDSTTARVVEALPFADLLGLLVFFAGSNAAGSFWARVALERPDTVPELALDVLGAGDAAASETTLHILLLDPHSDVRLSGPERLTVLSAALEDPRDAIRGIAADVLADEAPAFLATTGKMLWLDTSEQARMAGWDASFAVDFETAREAAFSLALDDSAPLEPRRTAIAALSAVLSTNQIAPLLQMLVIHPNRVLAEDAANLLWAFHRAPAIALAASQSPHDSVRALAERLLHPATGSPAAGGSRAGAPDAPGDIYREMLRGYERRDDE